jgi:hypothetical protein
VIARLMARWCATACSLLFIFEACPACEWTLVGDQ